MIIDINNTKNDLVANISNMVMPEKIKKISGKPDTVITLNDVGNNFIIMKSYYTQCSNTIELTIKNNGYRRDVGKATGYYRVVGNATGYGYHRESAALQDALDNLNITLFDADAKQQFIDGRGDTAMRDVLLAIAKSLNWGESVIMNEIYL